MSIRIRIEHGQDAGKTWRLSRPGVYVLGRHTDSSIRVLDMKVSKTHAELHLIANNGSTRVVFRDLQSTHGSQVNGQPVNGDKPLRAGDELRLGLTILRVLSDGAADEELAPIEDRETDKSSRDTATRSGSTIDTSKARKLPPDALVGKTLGGYRVEQKIGQGGMGAVYLAEQVSLKRQVALKVLSEKFVKDEAFVDQFLNEARAAGALNHPNVVQVYDVGEAGGHYYFSMEFVSGGSIQERLRLKQPSDWATSLNWFLDATNALVFANRRGTLHRDVKPDNLMISEDGSAKLCDLGLAKRSDNRDLMDQGIIGTPHFISPEAIRRKTDIDQRTDLYSLGCTFFRVFAGRNPYPGKSVKEILLGHLNRPVPHISDFNKELPKELDAIVFRLMQKDPAERFQTAAELLVELDKVRVRHGLEAHGIAPKSGRRWIIVAAVAVLVAVGGVVFALNQETTTVTVKDPEDIRAREEAARIKITNRYPPHVTEAQGELQEIRSAETDVKASDPINFWDRNMYAAQAVAYDAFAKRWKEKIDAWAKERAKYKHPEILSTIDTVTGQVQASIDTATRRAEDIRDTIRKRKASAAERKQTRADSLAAIKEALDKRKQTLETLSAAGRDDPAKWVELADALGGTEEKAEAMLKDLVQPLFEAAVVKGEPVLDYDRDVKPLLAKRFPPGSVKRWLETPPQLLAVKAANRLNEAQAKARVNGAYTPESLQTAIDLLDKWLALLPENPAPADLPIAKAILAHRKTATEQRKRWVEKKLERRYLGVLTDRMRYHRMVLEIRAPLGYGDGYWFQFKHAQAKLTIESWARQLQTPEYKPLGAIWVRDTEAFTRLFRRLQETWEADKWGGERAVVYVDDNGVEKKCRCQRIELDRMEIKRRKEIVLFADLGPKRLLDHIFHRNERDGMVPRFAFAGEDFRGLALLAELAADFDRATTWWRAYQVAVEADSVSASDALHHMKLLPVERQVGETWTFVQSLRRKTTAMEDRYDRKLHPVSPEAYEEFLDQERPLSEMLGMMQEGQEKLAAGGEICRSVWAASLRALPHPEAAYAGLAIPKQAVDALIRRAFRAALPDERVPDTLPKAPKPPK